MPVQIDYLIDYFKQCTRLQGNQGNTRMSDYIQVSGRNENEEGIL